MSDRVKPHARRLHKAARARRRWVLLVAALTLGAVPGMTTAAVAQERDAAAPRPRVGLVLSGGSAKGFAHIGVLQELELAGVPIDVVAGASMGSIVGGLYAIGYTPAMLRRVAETEDWTGIFGGFTARADLTPTQRLGGTRFLISVPLRGASVALPTALISSQGASSILSRLVWAADTVADLRQLGVPFVAVATDLATGDAVPLTRGPLSRAMRASMALPGVFAPVAIDGRTLIDGGVARNLPVEDARALGADVLICVDVSDPLRPADSVSTAFDILMQVVAYRMDASTRRERAGCDVLIEPDIDGLSSVAFDRGTQWIARGVTATKTAMPRVRAALADRGIPLDSSRNVRTARPRWSAERVRVNRTTLRGDADGTPPAILPQFAAIRTTGARDVERMAARLYATGRYALVASHLVATPTGTDVQFDVVPSTADRVGLGLRYDTRYKAALLFGIELNDRLGAGSTLAVDARLGEQLVVQARYQPAARQAPRLVRGLVAGYVRTPLDIFTDGRAIARADVQLLNAAGFLGVVLPASTLAGIQLAFESGRSSAAIAPTAIGAVSQQYFTVSMLSWTDTFDRAAFPTRGVSLVAQVERAERKIGSGATFDRAVIDGEVRLPLREGTTVRARLALGVAHGADLPLYDRFLLGGAVASAVLPGRQFPFAALDAESRLGNALQLAEFGVQHSLGSTLFLSVNAAAGNTFERWPTGLALDRLLAGASVSLGTVTALGPASVTFGTRRLDARPRVAAEMGYRF